jgi:hypothetical protein
MEKKPNINLPLPGKLGQMRWVISSRKAAPTPLAERTGEVAYNVRTSSDRLRALQTKGFVPDES